MTSRHVAGGRASNYDTGMSRLRMPAFRRLLTLLLVVCLGSYGVESRVADVHEQQAVSEPGAGTELVTHPAGHVPSDSGSGDTHPPHVCHCTHAHLGVIALSPTLAVVLVTGPRAEWRAPRTAPSASLLPPLRPPIV